MEFPHFQLSKVSSVKCTTVFFEFCGYHARRQKWNDELNIVALKKDGTHKDLQRFCITKSRNANRIAWDLLSFRLHANSMWNCARYPTAPVVRKWKTTECQEYRPLVFELGDAKELYLRILENTSNLRAETPTT